MRLTLRSLYASIGLPALAGLLLVVAGCASTPPKGAANAASGRPAAALAQGARDGAEANPPAGLDAVADAEPRVEPIRPGGPNKPYEALGRSYVPFTDDRAFVERGLASWYGRKFHGRRTSSGEPYDMYAMTAAHPTLPIPSYARVRNPANGREIVVRINDRGPFHPGRVIDLSYTAALRLDLLRGVAPVEVERLTWSEIRAGTWRRGAPAEVPPTASAGEAARRGADATVMAVAPSVPSTFATAVPRAALATVATTVPPAALATVAASTAETAPAVFAADAATLSAGAAPGFWVQLGAFAQRDGAAAFQRRIAAEFDWLSPWLAIVADVSLFRLQAGPYPTRDQAREAAESIRAALQLVPVIVERR